MEENKEILELLKQIEKANRQQVWMSRILCVFAVITALCCMVTFGMIFEIFPQVSNIFDQIGSVLPQIDTVITQMQSVLTNLEQATQQLAALDYASMVSDVNALVVTGQQSLEQTMDKLNSIDFDTLNQAIEDLSKVIEPLAKVSNLFR